ncbi:MAG TPA: Rieske (2Fe-2S) protein [Pilimelia sp.]|nr:Rieske (2Fe-2S) protein [Pilimelia sp.]
MTQTVVRGPKALRARARRGRLFTALEQATGLDAVGDAGQRAVRAVLRPQRLRDALHGVWLGHALHPVLVQVPVGSWISTAVLDITGRHPRAATTLATVGTASALPAAVAGLNDWAALSREQRRVGIVHAVANTAALALYAASVADRLRGRHGRGRVLAFLGLSIAGGGAYVGGHLSYGQAAQVSQAAPELRLVPEGWHELGALAEFPDGGMAVRTIGDVPVLVARDGDECTVLVERCGHQRGPLGEGEVTGSGADRCVVCPWHGSAFRLRDGAVMHGPAASDQPLLRSRVVAGRVEAALP